LSGVFPLLLVTIVLERRSITPRLRRIPWIRNLLVAGVSSALVGEVLGIIGVEFHGYPMVTGILVWAVAATAFVCFAASLLMIIATDEIREDKRKHD
jgi:peptidoglycan biosynthesis protein MviN/MurJ (putative lipid II flippase)